MTKQQLIENLRIDAEWWLMAGKNTPYVDDPTEMSKLYREYGMYRDAEDNFIVYGHIDDYDCEVWFSLLIAESLEND